MNSLNMVADVLLWNSLFLFIFEMRVVRDIVISESPAEMKKKLAQTRATKYLCLTFSILSLISFDLILVFRFFWPDYFDNYLRTYTILSIFLRCIHLSFFAYLGYLWISLITFFVSKKKEAL